MGEQPETSTVRSSLAIVAAAEQLLGPADLDPEDAVALIDTVMVEARALRPHQVRDVADHLRARAESGAWQPVPAQPPAAKLDSPDELEAGWVHDGPPAHAPPFDDGRDERRARAVDNLTAEVLGGEDA